MARLTLLSSLALLALTGSEAFAQGYGYPPPGNPPPPAAPPAYGPTYQPPVPVVAAAPVRRGFTVGLGLGAGAFAFDCQGCDDSYSGIAGNFHIGFMANPRLAVVVEGSAVSHPFDGGTLTNSIGTIGVRYWASPLLWIKGGLGSGNLSASDDDGDVYGESETGAALTAGVGYEIVHSPTFAVDLFGDLAATSIEDVTVTMSRVGVGVSWY